MRPKKKELVAGYWHMYIEIEILQIEKNRIAKIGVENNNGKIYIYTRRN